MARICERVSDAAVVTERSLPSVTAVRRQAIVLLVAAAIVGACSGSNEPTAAPPVPKPGTLEDPPFAVDAVVAIDDHRLLAATGYPNRAVAVFDFADGTWTRLPRPPIAGAYTGVGGRVLVLGPKGGVCSADEETGAVPVVAASMDPDRDGAWRRTTLDLPAASCSEWSLETIGPVGDRRLLRGGRTFFLADRDLDVRVVDVPDRFSTDVCPAGRSGFRQLVHDPPIDSETSRAEDATGRVGPDGNLAVAETSGAGKRWTRVRGSETNRITERVRGGPAALLGRTRVSASSFCTPRGIVFSVPAATLEWDGSTWRVAEPLGGLGWRWAQGPRRMVAVSANDGQVREYADGAWRLVSAFPGQSDSVPVAVVGDRIVLVRAGRPELVPG
jgi:hypothetical protein